MSGGAAAPLGSQSQAGARGAPARWLQLQRLWWLALTNYLGMSFVMALIFQGWGLGLFDRFDRFEQWGFLLLGCVLMLGWSKPWMARFRFGPLEWLWRCLTYWRLFPFRRNVAMDGK